MEWCGQSKNGGLWLPRAVAEQRKHWLRTSEGKGDGVREKLTVIRGSKTYKQVKTVFGLCIGTIKYQFDDIGMDIATFLKINRHVGKLVPTSMIREYLYVVCPLYDDEDNPIRLSSNLADTANVARWITDIQATAAEEWGIYIPDPDPSWRSKEPTDE